MRNLLAAFVLTTAALMVPAASATAAANPWHAMTFNDQTTGVQLYAVDALSSTDAWAGGETHPGHPVFDHWNGSTWTHVKAAPVPNTTDAGVEGIKVLPAGVWAVGVAQGTGFFPVSFLEHSTDGSTFTLQRMPAYAELNSIDGSSATNLWAVGGDDDLQPVITHWDGTSWKKSYTLPGVGGQFLSVVEIASNDVWAMGNLYTTTGTHLLAAHWNGTSWKRVSVPPAPAGSVTVEGAVAGSSATNVWTAGFVSNDSLVCIGCHGVIDTLTGGAWTPRDPPTAPIHRELYGIATTGPTNVWAVGSRRSADYRDSYNLLDHWNGSSWTSFGGPNVGTVNSLDAITTVPGLANAFWAVGTTKQGSAILRCC